MNLTEKTVIEGIITNLEFTACWDGNSNESENEHKKAGISAAIRMLERLISLPLSEEILPELNPRNVLKL